MSQPTYGIAITADDKTAKGVASAERRIGGITKRVDATNRASIGNSSRAILRTFSETEKATARIFGGRSIMAGVASRMGAIGEAAGAMGEGMSAAAAEGGLLTTVIGGVGAAVAGTVAVVAAAGYALFKMADGWARGAASIGRTAEIIGVGTKALQEFTAAAERAGVDKDKATGGIAGLSQTLNDARYGRNAQAIGLLDKLGVKLALNSDGTVDVAKMLPAIADALAKQNNSGRRTAARILGIPLETLPVFTQGGKALSADMADADKSAAVLTDDQIAKGKRITRKSAMVGQLKDRALMVGGEAVSDAAEPGFDAIVKGGRWIAGAADKFDTGAGRIDRAADKMERAANAIGRAAGGAIRPGLTAEVIRAAQATERKYGVPASITLAQYGLESSYGRRMPRGSNNPFGIKAKAGEPFVNAATTEVIAGKAIRTIAKFRVFDSIADAFDAHAKLLATGRPYAKARAALPDVGAYADELGGGTSRDPRYATDPRYGAKLRRLMRDDGLTRYNNGASAPEIPVKVDVRFENAPPGTRAKVSAGSKSPAVSYAFEPVRGG